MINLREIGDKCVWPECLKPKGYGDHAVEDFGCWWDRNREELNNLPEALAKQWIYRHWQDSVTSFIPLEGLECVVEAWPAHDFLSRVGTVRGNEPMDPVRDFELFSQKRIGKKHPTAKDLDEGYWDLPLVVLRTPEGFIDRIGEKIDKEFLLVEGHKRRRYLNALLNKGDTIVDQKVFVLRSPVLL